MNTYGFNTDDDPALFGHIISLLRDWPDAVILWGGDFNTHLDPAKDKSSARNGQSPKAARVIREGMAELGLLDIWRHRNVNKLEGAHVSTAHDRRSRLDYWLLGESGGGWVSEVRSLPRTLSDHNPVLRALNIPLTDPRSYMWCFHPEALLDPLYTTTIREAITQYSDKNKGSVDSAMTL